VTKKKQDVICDQLKHIQLNAT